MNLHEPELLEMYLSRKDVRLERKPYYEKQVQNISDSIKDENALSLEEIFS